MYDFGITLIIKSLDPIKDKLGTDTWYYTKRCFLSLVEKHCKKQYTIDSDLYKVIVDFLDKAYQAGKNITTIIYVEKAERHKSTVAYEAKFLKKIFLKLQNSKNKDNSMEQ
mmetsp:Transcript_16941/g.14873  ORF Transcript_16941/g.14873 Transcript_16941/m.14873 type:complete len:111 (+) Transcript_16941:1423-1755(+)